MKKLSFGLLLSIIMMHSLCAQEGMKRTTGISATLQNSSYGINIPIWIKPKFVLAPTLGLNYAGNVGTDITVGVMPKIYLKVPDKLVPYVNFRLAGIFNSPQNTADKNSKIDLLMGVGYGGEYFFNDNFSIAAEIQGNLTSSDKNSNRFGNPGNVNFNLATALTVNIYFTK